MPTPPALNIIKAKTDVLSWGTLGPLMVTFAIEGDLPEQRLDALIADAKQHSSKFVLAASLGRYKMTSLQRKKSTEGFGQLTRIATVISDPITRGVITAFGWLGLNIKSFAWNKIEDACAYVAPPDVAPKDVFQLFANVRRSHYAVTGDKDEDASSFQAS